MVDDTTPDEAGDEAIPEDEAQQAPADEGTLSEEDQEILDEAERDLVAEMRNDMLRAQAELVNFRNRVERDRQVNREATIAEVLRALLPVLDDLDRAEEHGDVAEGTPMGLIAVKLRTSFERFGLERFGAVGEAFDPEFHEALFQQPTAGATAQTLLEVLEMGYRFGERVVRPAKVVVAVPAED